MKKCIWCKKDEETTTFEKKAHSIPLSLGGMNFNRNVCDECNKFFGFTLDDYSYSIEEALKETLCISRERLLNRETAKRKVGSFKSKFFDVKDRNGKLRLSLKKNIFLNYEYQRGLCHNFKKGLIKMWFEEYSRQNPNLDIYSDKFDYIRNFARYNSHDIPIYYFNRKLPIFLLKKNEAETPRLIFNRSTIYLQNENYFEFEFLGQVFGFPISSLSDVELTENLKESLELKKTLFKDCVEIKKIFDIDFLLM